ncbi:MAG: DUF99 family protein [Candidatus Pacearchaeota archaeon]|nr:DUF99 family protein [Candidatus Pacearchaeota archaeon]
MIKRIKKEIRILGIDDGPFQKGEKECLVVGTIYRGGSYIDGVLSCYVSIDGNDATKKIIELIKKTRHLGQLRCIMLKGISFGGFNVVDIKKIRKEINLPVIVFMRKKPNLKEIFEALRKAGKSKEEIKEKENLIKKAGKIFSTKIKNKIIYFQISGISRKKAAEIIKIASTHGIVPEPLRVAHMIAQGVILGESRGKA